MTPTRIRLTTVAAATVVSMFMGCTSPAALETRHAPSGHQSSAATSTGSATGLVYVVKKTAKGYRAVPRSQGKTYRGTLKTVLQATAAFLDRKGGGKIRFTAGTFDFGGQYFLGKGTTDVAFVGAGMRKTLIKNFSNAAADTEPFNFFSAFGVKVRDLSVAAGGSTRTTSDALDFDRGNDVVVARVRVVDSRGRGIVFDGKDSAATSLRNRITGCVIRHTTGHGIELLASSRNVVERCRIRNVGGSGIMVKKSTPSAVQPNKKSSRNLIRYNRITDAGENGIIVISGNNNRIIRNRVYNSADEVANHDGIRIDEADGVSCDDNKVSYNIASDNQKPKTQRYGLNISSRYCHRTVVGPGNKFKGNLRGRIHDEGTATKYQ